MRPPATGDSDTFDRGATVLGAEALAGLSVLEARVGDMLRLQTWEALDEALVCGITTADSGDFGVAGATAGHLVDVYGALAAGLGFARVSVPLQVHGTELALVDETVQRRSDARVVLSLAGAVDGQISLGDGCLLASTAADCVPVYLWDRSSGRLGLLHAGWRGVAAGILPRALHRMRIPGDGVHGESLVADILVHLGPAICGRCYEVDEPVLGQLGFEGDRALVDLRGVLVGQATEAGVSRSALSVSAHCSVCGPGALYSHRDSEGKAGRMAAFVGLRHM